MTYIVVQLPLSAITYGEIRQKVVRVGESSRIIDPSRLGSRVEGIDLTHVAVTQLSDDGRIWEKNIGYIDHSTFELATGPALDAIALALKIRRVLGDGTKDARLLTDRELRGLIVDRRRRLAWVE